MSDQKRNIQMPYNSSPRTRVDGEVSEPELDSLGNQKAVVMNEYDYSYQASLTASVNIKSGSGNLSTIVIGTKGSADSAIVVRDSLLGSAGTLIATISTAGVDSYVFNIKFSTGLSVALTGTTAAKATIIYN